MKQRENTELIVWNCFQDGSSLDFTSRLHQIQESIEMHKAKIELGDKYNLEPGQVDALPELIFDSRRLKDLLTGRFDILIINDMEHERE